MTSPWAALDAATADNKLYLDPAVIQGVNNAAQPYETSLQTLIDDALDRSNGFGTSENPLAVQLQTAFNQRGTALTGYLTQQLSQTKDFVKTAQDAAAATQARDQG